MPGVPGITVPGVPAPPNDPSKPNGKAMTPPTTINNPGIIMPKLSSCSPIFSNGIGKLNKNNGNVNAPIKNGSANNPNTGIAMASFNSVGKITPFSNINPGIINGRTNRFMNKNGTNNGSNAFPSPTKPTNGNASRCANKLFNNINGLNAKNVNTLASNGNPSTNRGLIRIFRGRITKSNRSLSTPGSANSVAKISPNNLKPLTKLPSKKIGANNNAGSVVNGNKIPKLIKIGKIDFTIGNVNKVLRPKFNKNNGNVSNPEINGNANNPRMLNPV